MKRMLAFAILFCQMFCAAATGFETRDELRAAYRALGFPEGDEVLSEPARVSAPYAMGVIDPPFEADALGYLNLMRTAAGLAPLQTDAMLTDRARRAATLIAANGAVSHEPPRPNDMDEDFYISAALGAGASCLAELNWRRAAILRDGVDGFVRDDGEENARALGHRRWLLNPEALYTGFGLAHSEKGLSYVAIYAQDTAAAGTEWSQVRWPAEGLFPAEWLLRDTAWSITLNADEYDLHAQPLTVTLTERDGRSYVLPEGESGEDGFCTLSEGRYGPGPCLIFRPAIAHEYEQNQVYTVRVDGLRRRDGAEVPLEYSVFLVSLTPQDVAAVELDRIELALRPDETAILTASVIPAYADDLTVTYATDDPNVATVDAHGAVTAVAPGACRITATSVNGRTDVCAVQVG